MTPVSSATSVPTASAFCMKWNRSKSWTSASRSQTGWSTTSGARVLVVPDRLLLAARHLAQRALRVSVRTHQPDGAPDALAGGPAREGERQAPAGSVEAQPHEVQAPDPKVGIEGSALRQVAHVVVAPPHPPAEDADRPLSQWHQPQGALHQRRLAGAVGAQDGRELALADLEVHVPPDEPGAEPDAGVLEADRGPGQISLRAPPAAI